MVIRHRVVPVPPVPGVVVSVNVPDPLELGFSDIIVDLARTLSPTRCCPISLSTLLSGPPLG